jgi:hypothetical protein
MPEESWSKADVIQAAFPNFLPLTISLPSEHTTHVTASLCVKLNFWNFAIQYISVLPGFRVYHGNPARMPD